MRALVNEEKKASSCGKVILVGEHAVVYGSQAVAMALPNVSLQIIIYPEQTKSWETSWFIEDLSLKKNPISSYLAPPETQIQLTQAFAKALSLCGISTPLSEFMPQQIHIRSQIPLGGGLGGSAAISVSLIRLASQLLDQQLNFSQEAALANEIDNIFHSNRASGLDASAIASRGMISFSKIQGVRRLHNKCTFWLALVDSGERSATSLMVKKVAEQLDISPENTKFHLQKMGELATQAIVSLESNLLKDFSDAVNDAHISLQAIGVSTPKIDSIIEKLREQGALAAKVTGAGGGGLVMGVFDREPYFIYDVFENSSLFIVPVTPENTPKE